MFRTHPSIKERLAIVEAEPPYPATPALTDAEWRALKSICGDKAATPKSPSTAPATPKPAPRKPAPETPPPRPVPQRDI